MITVDQEYTQEVECIYKGETFMVRDNGAIMRLPKNGKTRPADNKWTFGKKDSSNGYMFFTSDVRVHQVVATAFHGEPDDPKKVVDHKDTNRCNNRPENLQWLTRLENVLLNPNTRSKIEFLCGSVEAFLENPHILDTYVHQDRNFEWMRTVSKEEAANLQLHWKELFEKKELAIKNKDSRLGEFMFEKPKRFTLDELLENSKRIIKTPLEQSNSSIPMSPVNSRSTSKRVQKNEEEKKEEKKQKAKEYRLRRAQKKKEFEEMLSGLKTNLETDGFHVSSNEVIANTTAELLVENESQKLAVFFKAYYNEDLELELNQNGINGCWLSEYGVIHSELPEEKQLKPCFSLRNGRVEIGYKTSIELKQFIESFINGKVVKKTEAILDHLYIIAWQNSCYKCGRVSTLFFVQEAVSKEGLTLLYRSDFDDLYFDPRIYGAVKEYYDNHPEKGIVLATAKERYSRTMDETYMSFGCPSCDALFGDYYLNDSIIDLINIDDHDEMEKIDVSKQNIILPISQWMITE